ncbi:MAG: hypothetical protein AB1410_03980 [Acidobacteriota bacterium]
MNKKFLIIVVSFFFMSLSCKREEVIQPEPVTTPQTEYYILQGTANPSILFAGDDVQRSIIKVILKSYKGDPVSNVSIYFETWWDYTLKILTKNLAGVVQSEQTKEGFEKCDIGRFEPRTVDIFGVVGEAKTDSSGTATITYCGPNKWEARDRTNWSVTSGSTIYEYKITINNFYIKAYWNSDVFGEIYSLIPIKIIIGYI